MTLRSAREGSSVSGTSIAAGWAAGWASVVDDAVEPFAVMPSPEAARHRPAAAMTEAERNRILCSIFLPK